jgi:hypothetical protein
MLFFKFVCVEYKGRSRNRKKDFFKFGSSSRFLTLLISYTVGVHPREQVKKKYRYRISSIGPQCPKSIGVSISNLDIEVSEYQIPNNEKSIGCPGLHFGQHF